jgi:hypothetical protein
MSLFLQKALYREPGVNKDYIARFKSGDKVDTDLGLHCTCGGECAVVVKEPDDPVWNGKAHGCISPGKISASIILSP